MYWKVYLLFVKKKNILKVVFTTVTILEPPCTMHCRKFVALIQAGYDITFLYQTEMY
jgi:hypothetical protein